MLETLNQWIHFISVMVLRTMAARKLWRDVGVCVHYSLLCIPADLSHTHILRYNISFKMFTLPACLMGKELASIPTCVRYPLAGLWSRYVLLPSVLTKEPISTTILQCPTCAWRIKEIQGLILYYPRSSSQRPGPRYSRIRILAPSHNSQGLVFSILRRLAALPLSLDTMLNSWRT